MSDFEFRPISLDNLDEVIALEVRPDQKHLVADNCYSIAQAGLDPEGWCRAAYLHGMPVGFLYVRQLDGGARVYLRRFMVDQYHQGRGLGRQIMAQLVTLLFSNPAVEVVDLAVLREPRSCEGFYERCGFVGTNEQYRGGWRMMLMRARYMELQSTHERIRQDQRLP